jgi:ribosomal protein S18 acetylase RimI-like enzyme
MDKSIQLTLIADINQTQGPRRELVSGYSIRRTSGSDKRQLAELYYNVYPRRIVKDLKAASLEMEQVFGGMFGKLDWEASPVALYSNKIIASVQTVEQAPWDLTPSGPFIIQAMVHPDHSRLGLAEILIRNTFAILSRNGYKTVALRVISDNQGAVALYRKLGFVPWKNID